MKKIFLSLIILIGFFPVSLFTQNLVPNPSFETTSNCNNGLVAVANWINPDTATPDYFNACAPSILGQGFSVPTNAMGHQYAHTGDAYLGMIAYEDAPLFGCPNTLLATGWREYISVQLTSPLIAGVTYCAEYWINLSNNSRYSTDSHGMYFSSTPVQNVQTATALPYSPQIQNTNGQLADTLGWTKISGTYTATGGEQYILIGNFKNDANTNPQCFNQGQFFPYAYYLIDDVFVGVDGTCPGSCSVNASIAVSYTGCDAGNAILSASGTGGAGNISYLWSTGDTSSTLQNALPGTYTVTLTDSAGCSGTDTLQVSIPQGPSVNLGPDTFICKGESITLSGSTSPSTGITWMWGGGQTSTSINVTPGVSTSYSVEVSDSNGCTGEDSILVEVGITPAVFIDQTQDSVFCLNDPAFLLTVGTPTGGTYSGPAVANNQFDPNAAGTGQHILYYTVSDSVGCSSTDSFEVRVDLCSGIAENQFVSGLTVYPNPSAGWVTIGGISQSNLEVQVFNSLGQEVTPNQTVWEGDQFRMELNQAGCYFLLLKEEKYQSSIRLQIIR